jgi:hypothetical protein
MNIVKTQNKKITRKKVVSEKFDDLPTVRNVVFLKSFIEFHLTDKRIITIPLIWISKLKKATKLQRENYIIRGHFVFWDGIDEIIGVKNLLNGTIVSK